MSNDSYTFRYFCGHTSGSGDQQRVTKRVCNTCEVTAPISGNEIVDKTRQRLISTNFFTSTAPQ